MLLDDFRRYVAALHRTTNGFVRAVRDDPWEFTPDGQSAGIDTPPGWQRAWKL